MTSPAWKGTVDIRTRERFTESRSHDLRSSMGTGTRPAPQLHKLHRSRSSDSGRPPHPGESPRSIHAHRHLNSGDGSRDIEKFSADSGKKFQKPGIASLPLRIIPVKIWLFDNSRAVKRRAQPPNSGRRHREAGAICSADTLLWGWQPSALGGRTGGRTPDTGRPPSHESDDAILAIRRSEGMPKLRVRDPGHAYRSDDPPQPSRPPSLGAAKEGTFRDVP